jgi:hypothetical protein
MPCRSGSILSLKILNPISRHYSWGFREKYVIDQVYFRVMNLFTNVLVGPEWG